jgi:hypothetical protein
VFINDKTIQLDNSEDDKYEAFLRNKGEYPEDDKVVFFAIEDLDLDGRKEVLIAIGNDTSPVEKDIDGVYIFPESIDQLEKVGDNLVQGGYGTYDIKLVHLQGKVKKYILLGTSNGAGMIGFKLLEYSDNKAKLLFSSESPTGSGEDGLTDDDGDGYYEGSIQYRSSYDVLYYQVRRVYKFENNEFVWKHTYVDIPEYPEAIKDVINQYLGLRLLLESPEPKVEFRLSELCTDIKANDISIPYEIGFSLLGYDAESAVYTISESNDQADAMVALRAERSMDTYTFQFHLVKENKKWVIDKLELKT